MTVSMAILTFLNAWWILLFVVLPFEIKTPESRTEVEYAGAPKAIRWRRLLAIDTALAAFVTTAMALLFNSGLLHIDTMI